MAADDAPGFADAELWWQIDNVGFLEARHRAQEIEGVDSLAAALDFPSSQIVGLKPVDRGAIRARELGEIHPPFNRRALRPYDRGLARKTMRPRGLGGFHQGRNRPPGLAGLVGIDAIEPEHHRGIEHAAIVIADLIA